MLPLCLVSSTNTLYTSSVCEHDLACRIQSILICSVYQQNNAHLFYSPLDFVWDYPGEPAPEPIWILLSKQETVSGYIISWAMQISTSLQTDNHATTHHSFFSRPDAIPATQPTASKHYRQYEYILEVPSLTLHTCI